MRKKEFRRRVSSLRTLMSTDEEIERRVCSLQEFEKSAVVFCYLSFGSEVPTRGIIRIAWDSGKTVALPRCGKLPREMNWYKAQSFEGLERSSFGVEEPPALASNLVDPFCISGQTSIAIVPGLCFDEQGYRLGYGGGYYDEFLRRFRGKTVGVCREAQMIPRLESLGLLEPHDLPVEVIVTEKRTIRV